MMKGLEEIQSPDEDLDILSLHREITRKLKVHTRRDDKPSRSPKSVSPRSPRSPKTGNKCGRPSNPIPRHKRDSHIKAEHRRRDKIQKGFDTLRTLVPALEDASAKESKAVMLFQTAEHCRKLEADCKGLQDEEAALRQEIQSLGSQIHELQTKLPASGIEAMERPGSDIDQLYEVYIHNRSKKHWKFWLFDFMIKPLFESFKTMVMTTTYEQFTDSVTEWVRERLPLPNLRLSFLSSLREISKKTKILDDPSKLPEEAIQHIAETRERSQSSVRDSSTSLEDNISAGLHHMPPNDLLPTKAKDSWDAVSLPVMSCGDLKMVYDSLMAPNDNLMLQSNDDNVSRGADSGMNMYGIPVTSSGDVDMSFADSLLTTLAGVEPMIVSSLPDQTSTDVPITAVTTSDLHIFTSTSSFQSMSSFDFCSSTLASNAYTQDGSLSKFSSL